MAKSLSSLIVDIPGFLAFSSPAPHPNSTARAPKRENTEQAQRRYFDRETTCAEGGDDRIVQRLEKQLARDWPCQRCSLVNNPFTVACEACGLQDISRTHLLDRQSTAITALAERQAQDEHYARKLASTMLHDIEALSDGDGEDGASGKETTMNISSDDSSSLRYQPATNEAFGTLQADMLVQILAFLVDPRALNSIKAVSKTWCGACEDDELWYGLRYAFFKQPGFQIAKQSTPKGPTQSTSRAATTWICHNCQLTQARRYGTECEMCGHARPSDSQNSRTPYVRVTSIDHLVEEWCNASFEAKSKQERLSMQQEQLLTPTPFSTPRAPNAERTKGSASLRATPMLAHDVQGQSYELRTQWHVGITTEEWHLSSRSVGSWYHRCKVEQVSKQFSARWEVLNKGWEWTREKFRAVLCSHWEHTVGAHIFSNSDRSSQIPFYPDQHASAALGRTFTKLMKRNWVLLYDCLKVEMNLQADALARDVLTVQNLSEIPFLLPPSTDGNRSLASGVAQAIAYITLVVKTFEVYSSWIDTVEDTFWPMNERISNEKQNRMGAMGVSTHTPYVAELGMLTFRNSFLLRLGVLEKTLQHMQTLMTVADSAHEVYGVHHSKRVKTHVLECPTNSCETQDELEELQQRQLETARDSDSRFLLRSVCFTDEELLSDHITEFSTQERYKRSRDEFEGSQSSQGVTSDPSDTYMAAAAEIKGSIEALGQLYKFVTELDVSDDNLSQDRQTQGTLRRLFFIPLKRCEGLTHTIRAIDSTRHENETGVVSTEDLIAIADGTRNTKRGRGRKAYVHQWDCSTNWAALTKDFV